jgi:DNA adenine methylase
MTVQDKRDYLVENFNLNQVYATRVAHEVDKELFNDEYIARLLEEKPKPFVKWVGGKRQLLKQFKDLALYPPEHFNPDKNHYFEPFVGGGAVFFDLLPTRAYLSDMNFDLVTTYNVIKTDVESLISSLNKHVYEKQYFLNVRSQKVSDLSLIEIASRFIYLNRTCFNGMYRVNSKGQFNVPFGRYDKPLICDAKNLLKVSKTLQNIKIVHNDYKEVLKRAKKGDFVYFDPPYHPLTKTASFTSYTKEDFNEDDQIELRDTYITLHKRGCFVMLSNSNSDFINRIYSELIPKGITIHKVNAGRAINSNASKRGKITEVIVTNY